MNKETKKTCPLDNDPKKMSQDEIIKSIENSQIMDTGEQLDAEELFENYKEYKKHIKCVRYEDFVESLNIIDRERIGPWAKKLNLRNFN